VRRTVTGTARVFRLALLGLSLCLPIGELPAAEGPPNVLFLAVDDLNDWVGCLGGHPQAKTPHIDRLAGKGVLFEQAYCAAPLCHPSRTAIMTGLRPSRTGIYGNLTWLRDHPDFKQAITIPQHFRQAGYKAWTGGKIFHQPHGKWSDPASWDGQYSTRMGTLGPEKEKRYRHGMREMFSNAILARLIDWAPTGQAMEQTSDWQTADGAATFLQQKHQKPFFLACGIYRPHLSWYAPREFFKMHPIEEIQLPPYLESDLDDIPARGRAMSGEVFQIVRRAGQWKNAVQGYLAATPPAFETGLFPEESCDSWALLGGSVTDGEAAPRLPLVAAFCIKSRFPLDVSGDETRI